MAETKYGQSILDAQLDEIVALTTRILLVPSYDRSDTYATVDGKWIAEKAVTGEPGTLFNGTYTDDTSQDVDAPNRRMAVNPIVFDDAFRTNTEGTDLCQVLVSGTEILAVSNESSTPQRAVAIDDSITSFGFYIQASQPTQV